MRWRNDDGQPASLEQAFDSLNVDALKRLSALVATRGEAPKRKGELVTFLSDIMRRPDRVRTLYAELEPLAQKAVQEAVHHPRGLLVRDRFQAKYGRLPAFHHSKPLDEKSYGFYYDRHPRPTKLALFYPSLRDFLPADLQQLLLAFVPPPPPFTLPTQAEPPLTVRQIQRTWKNGRHVEETVDVPVRVRETAREALLDLKAVLRLVETGRVKVTEKKRQPTAASVQAVAAVLQGGDFYGAEDRSERDFDPGHDLAIKAFAWPVLLQAGGMVQPAGGKLELTPAGRKALLQPAHETIRAVWKKWRNSNLLDEFSRIEAIKGQGKAKLSAQPARRNTFLKALADCPAGAWFAVDDFFRFVRATGQDCPLAHRPYELYIAEHYYGNFGSGGGDLWALLQGHYILALFFEYLATLGLLDVAYLPPQKARTGYRDRWGTEDLACLSRYDGLSWVRINSLGAWCLGVAEKFVPPALEVAELLQVLPNLDVVVKKPPLPAADRLLLERFAEQQSDAVWHLSREKALARAAEGGSLDELAEFLAARSVPPLPQTAQVFLEDLRQRVGQLRDLGLARLIECADANLARLLANDSQLRGKCQLAGERWLVFRSEDEAAVLRGLRRLGYILPPPG